MSLMRLMPSAIASALERIDKQSLCELRLRVGMPLVVGINGRFTYLSATGATDIAGEAMVIDKKTLDHMILKASDFSLYTVNDQIGNAYLTVSGGIRIGLCGEAVKDATAVKTLKNFSSAVIRVPHCVTDCALRAFSLLTDGDVKNTLVISPPGGGKTTFLRDFARLLGSLSTPINTLIIDERAEIASCAQGVPQLDVGVCDVMTNCPKSFGFEQGIRAMRPDVIVTDELMSEADIVAVERAIDSGVRVAASVHAVDRYDLEKKPKLLQLFDRFVFLSDRKGPGTYESILDRELRDYLI